MRRHPADPLQTGGGAWRWTLSRLAPRPWLIAANDPVDWFPPVEHALTSPDGLLAIGGDLRRERLLHAYRQGIFPWYSEGQPPLWWSPDPRCVLFPERFRRSRSLRRTLRREAFRVTVDEAFEQVLEACATVPRGGQDGTWITPDMSRAYAALHRAGDAHSVECWRDGTLAGGLYGVAIGRVFFGESMFSRRSDASKVALDRLCRGGYALIDCQMSTPHLLSLGCECVSRASFVTQVERWCEVPAPPLEGPDGG